jgi:hypothetical protein
MAKAEAVELNLPEEMVEHHGQEPLRVVLRVLWVLVVRVVLGKPLRAAAVAAAIMAAAAVEMMAAVPVQMAAAVAAVVHLSVEHVLLPLTPETEL